MARTSGFPFGFWDFCIETAQLETNLASECGQNDSPLQNQQASHNQDAARQVRGRNTLPKHKKSQDSGQEGLRHLHQLHLSRRAIAQGLVGEVESAHGGYNGEGYNPGEVAGTQSNQTTAGSQLDSQKECPEQEQVAEGWQPGGNAPFLRQENIKGVAGTCQQGQHNSPEVTATGIGGEHDTDTAEHNQDGKRLHHIHPLLKEEAAQNDGKNPRRIQQEGHQRHWNEGHGSGLQQVHDTDAEKSQHHPAHQLGGTHLEGSPGLPAAQTQPKGDAEGGGAAKEGNLRTSQAGIHQDGTENADAGVAEGR